MGVPAFYRWLSEKYPKIVQDVLEERVQVDETTGRPLPLDWSKPNPSHLECDHLYLDLNGIIHPCSHPEQGPQPKTEQDMYNNVCLYIDRLVRVIRPRALLYLAIDGVAPRAKMNQQRARRFRAVDEAKEVREMEKAVREQYEAVHGQAMPPSEEPWDSNVITPGTPFMLRLSEYLRFYIRQRLSRDKAWQSLRVIFSDASIPGEGEHKIMSHVRLQRALPGYNPNTVHVLHGLDADLIMLALATHEAHFYISREEVVFGRKSQEIADQRRLESGFADEQRQLDEAVGPEAMARPENSQKPLQRISIPILREYLAAEFECCLTPGRLPFAPSLERLIDDIVFLCFFVGNDFLPHLPSLDIRDGALDYLFNVYKRILPGLGDYMTKSGGNVNLSHVDVILAEVGAIEDHVFGMKHENEMREQQRRREIRERNKQTGTRKGAPPPPDAAAAAPPRARVGRAARILEKEQGLVALKRTSATASQQEQRTAAAKAMEEEDNLKAAEALKQSLEAVKKEATAVEKEEEKEAKPAAGIKRKRDEDNGDGPDEAVTAAPKVNKESGVVGDIEDEFEDDAGDDDDEDEDAPNIDELVDKDVKEIDPEVKKAFKEKVKARQRERLDQLSNNVEDNVRLHESGWKDRYYKDKCKADDVAANGGREHMFRSYVMGLCWVMKYYYEGCVSWKWYYPFHYAPFASDLRNIERFEKDCKSFELAKPFNPVEQLMAVLPAYSSHTIPKASRWLMTDPQSPISDFYPDEAPVDPNGKAMPWLWVVLLPFIDEERLLAAMSPSMTKWTKEELLCNARGLDDGYVYIHRSHPLAKKLSQVLKDGKTASSPKVRLTDAASYGCPGFNGSLRPPLSNEVHPIDEVITIEPPASADKIDSSVNENVFADAIEPNDAICIAFTEPLKLSHKSVLLPGSRPPAAQLGQADKRIRRPRLNRGGATIANMGMSNGQSYNAGYGSMNMGTYERDLAQRQGRGRDMYQPGTRAWGAMEPTPKQFQHGVRLPNPLMAQDRGGPPPPQQQQQGYRPPPRQHGGPPHGPPPPQQQQGYQYGQSPQNYQHGYANGGPYQQQQSYRQQPDQSYDRRGNQPPPGRWNPAPQQQQQSNWGDPRQQQQQQGYNYNRGPPLQQHNPRPGQPQQQQGYNFRNFGSGAPPPPQNRPPQQQQQRSRANADVMNNLRAQLTSTLNQNRRQGDGPR